MEKGGGGGGAPTGCYKCGRPGHWSRDCPSSNPTTTKTSTSNPHTTTNNTSDDPKTTTFGGDAASASASTKAKPKRVPRSRPKLTPDVLLSDKGLGHILRHFPRAFKYRGRGREVNDLGYLLGLYAEWHSGLLPYYSFDQFIAKVEKIGASKRVKLCMKGLRDRVADGVDPAKLYEPQALEQETNHEQEVKDLEPTAFPEDTTENPTADDFQEIMLSDAREKATEEPSHQKNVSADASSGGKEATNEAPDNVARSSEAVRISEEQRARMEANKLKALQRAAARNALIKSTQSS